MEHADKYFELFYMRRIHEFKKIDQYFNWPSGKAKTTYEKIDAFYLDELKINYETLERLREEFKLYNVLYTRYYNESRIGLFEDYRKLLQWYKDQNARCNYCEITESQLKEIVRKRNGNLTLNKKTKRSKGTLEIEKMDPNQGYTFENAVLACPFCNNAKSNLISDSDWRDFFKLPMQKYIEKLLTE